MQGILTRDGCVAIRKAVSTINDYTEHAMFVVDGESFGLFTTDVYWVCNIRIMFDTSIFSTYRIRNNISLYIDTKKVQEFISKSKGSSIKLYIGTDKDSDTNYMLLTCKHLKVRINSDMDRYKPNNFVHMDSTNLPYFRTQVEHIFRIILECNVYGRYIQFGLSNDSVQIESSDPTTSAKARYKICGNEESFQVNGTKRLKVIQSSQCILKYYLIMRTFDMNSFSNLYIGDDGSITIVYKSKRDAVYTINIGEFTGPRNNVIEKEFLGLWTRPSI